MEGFVLVQQSPGSPQGLCQPWDRRALSSCFSLLPHLHLGAGFDLAEASQDPAELSGNMQGFGIPDAG